MEIRRYTKKDFIALSALWTRPEVWKGLVDDYTADADAKVVILGYLRNPTVYLVGKDPEKDCFVFVPFGGMGMAEVHTVFAREARHKVQTARDAVGWLFENTQYRAVSTFVQIDKKERHSLGSFFASACGMNKVGVLPKSFKRDGVFLDQVLYQATLEDYQEMRRKLCRQ